MEASLFGPLNVVTTRATLGPQDFRGVKSRQLLEILLIQRGRAISKERLAELLWEDAAPDHPAAALENYASILRRILDPGDLQTVHGGYRIAAERVDLDLDRFDALYSKGTDAGFRAALEVVRGDVLEGEPANWAVAIRQRYRERHVDALVEAAWGDIQAGDLDSAEALAGEAVQLDPAAERAYAALMLVACSRRRYSKALRLYAACTDALMAELGAAPSTWFERLHQRLLEGAEPAALVSSPELAGRT